MAEAIFGYLLLCSDGSYYAGHTDDLQRQLAEHSAGLGSRHTRSRLPVSLAWSQEFATAEDAKVAKHQLKGWSRAKKQALTEGRFDLISGLASGRSASRALGDAPEVGSEALRERG